MNVLDLFKLDGKVALVTGAATGLGAAIAVALARAGADVAISDKPEVSLDETADKLSSYNHHVFKLGMDVRDLGQIQDGVKASIDHFKRVDILVNNAGITRDKLLVNMTPDRWASVAPKPAPPSSSSRRGPTAGTPGTPPQQLLNKRELASGT